MPILIYMMLFIPRLFLLYMLAILYTTGIIMFLSFMGCLFVKLFEDKWGVMNEITHEILDKLEDILTELTLFKNNVNIINDELKHIREAGLWYIAYL